MAGIDTVLKGGRQAFTKEILIDRTLPILISQMRTDRKWIAAKIWNNLANYSDAEYPLPLALTHLNEYYHAGTINGALTNLGDNITGISIETSRQVESEVPNVDLNNNDVAGNIRDHDNIDGDIDLIPPSLNVSAARAPQPHSVLGADNLLVNTFTYGEDENSEIIKSFIYSDGVLSSEKNEKLKNWMNNHGISEEITTSAFISGVDFSKERQAVVDEFNLNGD